MITTNWPKPNGQGTSHFIKRQAEFLQAAGVNVDVFHFRGKKSVTGYFRAWWALRSKLRSGKYDLVHAQYGHCGLTAFPTRLPLVVTLRGSDILGTVSDDSGRYTLAGKVHQALTRFVAAHADAVVMVSAHMASSLRGAKRTHVIPSGIDFDHFRCVPRAEARGRLGLPPDERLVLFAGNPGQARKRYALAEAAVEILNRRLPARLVVAWNVPHSDIPAYMCGCDALVFTSMQEGSPNVVKEALACNLPVVSVPIGDVAQRIAGLDGCELCVDERPQAIAAALERVLRRGQRIDGRAAVEHLSESEITRQVISVYRSVLTGRSPAGPRNGRGAEVAPPSDRSAST